MICFALALWNGKDPILKERLFGVANSGGNHGEDVKEYYFYLDSTPTHSYMKYLYKYPQAAYPYEDPSGQIPAYEWNFGDVNPPVHAWSTIFTHRMLKSRQATDVEWLERSFHKLLLNFTWWVNRKDLSGRNAFEGGFLGSGRFSRRDPNCDMLSTTRSPRGMRTAGCRRC